VVTLNGVRKACNVGCRASPWPGVYRLRLLCHREGGFYICLPSESNGPNLLDEPLSGFYMISGVLGSREPMHLEVMTHSESVHLCAELKTSILAVLTDTSGLGTFTDR
jgi:hypothetical protein